MLSSFVLASAIATTSSFAVENSLTENSEELSFNQKLTSSTTYYSNTISANTGGTATLSNLAAQAGEKVNILFSCSDGYYLKGISMTTTGATVAIETDGFSYWFVQPAGHTTVNVTFEQGIGITDLGNANVSGSPFTDVAYDSWYYSYVIEAATRGWMAIPSMTTFEPMTNASRGMITASLYAMAGNPAVNNASSFSDVPSDSWYAAGIAWCEQNGIVAGVTEDSFLPDAPVTREQLTIMLRGFIATTGQSTEVSSFEYFADDSSISAWAKEHVYWAKEVGLVSGKANNNFDPLGTTTRAELAVTLLALNSKFIG